MTTEADNSPRGPESDTDAIPVFIPTAPHAAAIRTMLAACGSSIEGLEELLVQQNVERLRQGLVHSDKTDQEKTKRCFDLIERSIRSGMPPLADKIIATIAAEFTEDEAKQITAWYESPLGKRSVTDFQRAQANCFAHVDEWIINLMRGIEKDIHAILA